MEIIAWIIFGALAGWIASLIVGTNAEQGAGLNILLGITGAVIGGFIMRVFGGSGVTGFNVTSLLVAALGAIVLLMGVRAVHR
jgi:uncharacterized membrane protein YeaQ/YmgE (transglycosylase-associated protein family)